MIFSFGMTWFTGCKKIVLTSGRFDHRNRLQQTLLVAQLRFPLAGQLVGHVAGLARTAVWHPKDARVPAGKTEHGGAVDAAGRGDVGHETVPGSGRRTVRGDDGGHRRRDFQEGRQGHGHDGQWEEREWHLSRLQREHRMKKMSKQKNLENQCSNAIQTLYTLHE